MIEFQSIIIVYVRLSLAPLISICLSVLFSAKTPDAWELI